MEAPDKIYVPQHNIEAGNIQELGELIVAGSTEYIRKDALIEWAKYQMSFEQGYSTGEAECAYRFAMRDLIEKLNTI